MSWSRICSVKELNRRHDNLKSVIQLYHSHVIGDYKQMQCKYFSNRIEIRLYCPYNDYMIVLFK